MKIGILGGGQLSKMLALAGIPMGLHFIFYFPRAEHSLNELGKVINGSYDDLFLLNQFAEQVDIITYENENIPCQTIEYLQNIKPVFPDKNAIAISQDRLLEKNFFVNLGIPTNQFIEINQRSDIEFAIKKFGYPIILKNRRQGYDGKGQLKINKDTDVKSISTEYLRDTIAEEYVAFDREISLIMARNSHATVCYDICENIHQNGILRKTRNIKNDQFFDVARSYLDKIMDELNYVGILTLEFFQKDHHLMANEMAPRVHNSGHWTIDACITSQFENHLRAITNLPLGNTASLTEAIMFNILNKMPNKNELLKFNGACIYDYGKKPVQGRKLGHLTLLGNRLNHTITSIESILK